METFISSYCAIKLNSVWVNGQLFSKDEEATDLNTFLTNLYKANSLNYPKFHKMDHLCKLGLLATEFLIRNTQGFSDIPKNETALVLSNNASSLDSDRLHVNAIADKTNYFPSPSVFVYTLPNIVIGEIAIKHKLTGENAFFVSENFDAEMIRTYIDTLFNETGTSAAICGWVNTDRNRAEAFVYCVKKSNFKRENELFEKAHNPQTLQQLYNS